MAEVKFTDVYGTIAQQKKVVQVFTRIMNIYEKKNKEKWLIHQVLFDNLEPHIVIIFYYMIWI